MARIKSQQDITSVVWSLAEQLHRLAKQDIYLPITSSFAKINAPDAVKRTVVSLQVEAAYPQELLDKVRWKMSEAQDKPEEVNRILSVLSQSSCAGGLGALMPDLIRGWQDNGMDVIA
ncbi:MAG: hypothetical protein JRI96_10050, partial [Deltaproteobacteria bacterium]|nr:hypothetical protein [Deltaproteobacteria bacterium]